MSYIFISHNHKDKEVARKLSTDLIKAGHSVWIDEQEILIGDSIINRISEGLLKVDYVIVLLSNNSLNSVWVKKEIDISLNYELERKNVFILPVLIENVNIPPFLQGKYYANITDKSYYEFELNKIIKSVERSTVSKEDAENSIAKLKAQIQVKNEKLKHLVKERDNYAKKSSCQRGR